MTKTQVEVITSVQRRRRWSRSEKERIVTAAMESGAVASEVARAAGIHTSQLFRWRQQLCERAQFPAAFNPVAVVSEPGPASPAPTLERAGVIDIEFAPAAGCGSPGGRVQGAPSPTEKKATFIKSAPACSLSTKLQSSQANSGCMRPELDRVLQ